MSDIKVKSFYKDDGLELNDVGRKAQNMFESSIEKVYTYWIDRGYSPSEAKEMLFSQVYETTTLVNATRIK